MAKARNTTPSGNKENSTTAADQARVSANIAKMVAAVTNEGSDTSLADPVLALVQAYRAGEAAFNAGRYESDEAADAAIKDTYGPPLKAIEKWEGNARSFAGAVEAIRLALDETTAFQCETSIPPLLKAALGYFDGQSKEKRDPLVDYGRSLGAAKARYNELDEKCSHARRRQSHREETIFERAKDEVYDLEQTMRTIIATSKASTLEGAAVQLSEALTIVDFIQDDFPEKDETYRIKLQFRQLRRLLFSTLGVVNELAEHKIEELMEYPWNDPWVAPEDENASFAAWEQEIEAQKSRSRTNTNPAGTSS